ncbi:MAG: DNA-binding protein [Thermoproteales archaeon]|nr:DNA-binding protein [Thermoproteales archaeon]RLE64584.1 MAG: DNA-binding protein [Thermoprotei archaeon]
MPRRTTFRVQERKKEVYGLLLEKGELPTSEIARITGLTHSQAFYILRLLSKEGRVEELRRGKVAYWRAMK